LISTETRTGGAGGNIEIQTGRLELTAGGRITASSQGRNRAGDISLHIKESLQTHNGLIETETLDADGGDITITSPGYLYLTDNTAITTSVKNQEGEGGNILLKPEFIVLDNSRIKADATLGKGGNIQITTNGIYNFSGEPIEQVITATSQFGVDGEIAIESPDVDLEAFLIILPSRYTEFDLPKPCNLQQANERSSFHINRYHEGSLLTPEHFLE